MVIKENMKNILYLKKKGEYIIELRFNINLTDCSYMFYRCKNIKYNMSYIFLSFLDSKINI